MPVSDHMFKCTSFAGVEPQTVFYRKEDYCPLSRVKPSYCLFANSSITHARNARIA